MSETTQEKTNTKREPDIVGIGKNPETHIIHKVDPLLSVNMSLAALKLLDAYLARINHKDPDKSCLRFTLSELEEYLGVTKLKTADLRKRTRELQQIITVPEPSAPDGYDDLVLFDQARCFKDEDGIYKIDLFASRKAMKYYFYPEGVRYLRYRLKDIVNLTSLYSYHLYLYLESQRFAHLDWKIDLEELKKIMHCTSDTYTDFRRFNSLVLKKSCEEVNAKTNCKFTYEPVRKNRKVEAIRFILEPIMREIEGQVEDLPEDQTVCEQDDPQNDPQFAYELDDPMGMLASACDYKFTKEEMQVIFQTLAQYESPAIYGIESSFPSLDDIEFGRHDYLAAMYAKLCNVETKQKVNNRYRYFLQMIENDLKKQ